MPVFQADKLKRGVQAIIEKTGSTPEEADIVADHLVTANLRGHDSHGVGMVTKYIDCFHRGLVKPNTAVTLVNDAGAIMRFDGGEGYGQRVAREATAQAIERTRETGLTLYTLADAFHVGRIGSYGEMAADAGFVALHFVNVADHAPTVAPFGGSDARLITNPVCISLPGAGEQERIILDMATSNVALGKVRVAYNKGVPMDEGVLIGPDGQPTTDPGVMFPDLRGALTPFGQHKGSGLGLISELLGGILSGGTTIQPGSRRREGIINNIFAVIVDPARLVDAAHYAHELVETIKYVKASPPQDPDKPVMVAGDPERKTTADRLKNGIPLDDNTVDLLLKAGESLGQPRDASLALMT